MMVRICASGEVERFVRNAVICTKELFETDGHCQYRLYFAQNGCSVERNALGQTVDHGRADWLGCWAKFV
jgi:hypothetical protein